jgi:5S rRNA maturation endonuclease (ribonuclease M5)
MLYSLETKYLDPTAPLMVRPKTDWKPNPVTQTYLRTREWQYYIPFEQKNARKEYKLKKREGQLYNLQHIPNEWVQLFLKTSQKEYDKMKNHGDYKKTTKIDLVKILLGANYLGKAQISYVQTMVQKAILQYSFNRLPSLIVFDDIEVAVAMDLDEKGYRIEKIVFRNIDELSPEAKYNKELQVKNTIRSINLLNQKLFEQKLKKYYQ